MIPAWVQFREAIARSVESYNEIEEGRECPAVTTESTDSKAITIQCNRNVPGGRFRVLVVVVKLGLVEKRIAITADIEEWETQQVDKDAIPPEPRKERFEFLVEAAEEVRLSYRGTSIPPADAADVVLMKALLPEEIQRVGSISIVKKQHEAA